MTAMTFERYEVKFFLTAEQKQKVLEAMQPYMTLDQYGRSTIRNIYYDTENYRLIRTSIEKPVYKEKLRIRSYKKVGENDQVFVELKKKYDHVVYKRRLMLLEKEVTESFATGRPLNAEGQIANEIEYFREYYETLVPAVFLSYEREAYYANDGSDVRITFDENILYRQENMSLTEDAYGHKLIDDGLTLMEVKIPMGIPMWLNKVLTENHIYKTSFSKYGAAYKNIVLGQQNQVAYKKAPQSLEAAYMNKHVIKGDRTIYA